MPPLRIAPILGSACAVLALAALLQSQDPPKPDPRLEPAAAAEADARRSRIREEVAERGAEPGWAGRYYYGDGTGVNVTLEIAPREGFVFKWSGCLGVYDRNYGPVTERDGRLELEFTFPNDRKGMGRFACVLVPVTWGERRYLVADYQMLAFANAINGGGEPRDGPHGGVLLRSGDEQRPAKGKPELPREAAALLLDEPVEGTIVAVHDSSIEASGVLQYRVSEATIDRGAQHGLRAGHAVHFVDGLARLAGKGTVIELAEDTARIRIRSLVLDGIPAPEAGWRWSTRWKRPR